MPLNRATDMAIQSVWRPILDATIQSHCEKAWLKQFLQTMHRSGHPRENEEHDVVNKVQYFAVQVLQLHLKNHLVNYLHMLATALPVDTCKHFLCAFPKNANAVAADKRMNSGWAHTA